MSEFLIELHMHTSEVSPCGKVSAREGIRLYKSLGYDAVVITDHFLSNYFDSLKRLSWREQVDHYLSGYRMAADEGEKLGLKVFLGLEFCVPGTNDDILVYGLDEQFLYDREDLCRLDSGSFAKKAQNQNLLLVQAHPFRTYISRVYDEIIEGMEVHNGNPRHESNNSKAMAYAIQNNLIAVSGSDFHQPQDAGTGGTYLSEMPGNSQELVSYLREQKNPKLVKEKAPLIK